MKRKRIYVDTSVIGGCFDPEFADWSIALMDDFRRRRLRLVVSDVTAAEVADAPASVKDLFFELLPNAEMLRVTAEALSLVEEYEEQGVLGPRFRNDMLHIAIATIADVDVLVSWNFRHIVRWDKIRHFNAVNIEMGYRPIAIFSPREVTTYGKED